MDKIVPVTTGTIPEGVLVITEVLQTLFSKTTVDGTKPDQLVVLERRLGPIPDKAVAELFPAPAKHNRAVMGVLDW
jgi:hypothetical protein